MGGLVAKKVSSRLHACVPGSHADMTQAYLLARGNPLYQHLERRIHSIYFLATPHRGADSAQTLSRLLASSLIYGSKTYVDELIPGSAMLQVRQTSR
jgi:hypothetical protein